MINFVLKSSQFKLNLTDRLERNIYIIMKKILFTLISFAIVASSIAQDAADKSFQAGLVFGAGMNFQKMGTEQMNSNGAGSDLTIGGNMNIMFNETIGLTTGIEFDFNTTKFKPGTANVYYLYNDKKIEEYSADQSGKQLYQLQSRKQKATYLTIPTMLLFRTNFIGYMRYFGKFGLRSSFLLSQKINDEGFDFDPDNVLGVSTPVSKENLVAKNEMFFFKSSVGIAGGAEWNFVGTTCLVAEIGYYYGITPLFYNRKDPYLFTAAGLNGTSQDVPFSNKATQSQLQLKISILF